MDGNRPQQLVINTVLYHNKWRWLLHMAVFFLLYSTGQHGLINIDEYFLANSLKAIVPQRGSFKSPDGTTKTNVWREGCEETREN